MSLLEQASKLGGVQMNTGTYLSITEPKALDLFLKFLHTAEERIHTERAARRKDLQQVATLLVLAGKLEASTASRINTAFDKATNVDHFNKLVNANDESDVSISYKIYSSVNVKPGYQRMHVVSGGSKQTPQDLGEFLISHGVYAYSKKLKAINDLISTTNHALRFGASINVDMPTLTAVEFINSTAFERYNETFRDLISQAMDAANSNDTIQEAGSATP